MEAERIKETAEEIVSATAGLPSARAIRELMAEYVSQRSKERRMVILLDVYTCLLQDISGDSSKTAASGSKVGFDSFPVYDPTIEVSLAQARMDPAHLSHHALACSFCELLHEFYPRGHADRTSQRLMVEHLQREHGVRLSHRRIKR